MAYIRTHPTGKTHANGKPVMRYEVCWRETVRDEFGLPVPMNPDNPDGPTRTRLRSQSFTAAEDAEARRSELNATRFANTHTSPSQARAAAEEPFGAYALAWCDTMDAKVARGALKANTAAEYRRLLIGYVLPLLGAKAIASVTPADCEALLVTLSQRNLSPKTIKHVWVVTRRVLKYAVAHGGIAFNPADRVDFGSARAMGDHARFEHHPLTADQVSRVAAIVGERYPAYELMVLFLAYSGLRSAECAGLELRDLTFSDDGTRCTVAVRRTKERRSGQWMTTTPKSKRSRRTVPLPGWLAVRMHRYVSTHPRTDEPNAPVWPSRVNGGARTKGKPTTVAYDWTAPVFMPTWYETVLKSAYAGAGLPISAPATETTSATRGVRLHDLRHTFAVLHLMAGTHFMQVSRWLGHATYTITLDRYGDWIPDETRAAVELADPTPGRPLPASPAKATVLPFRRQLG